MEPSPDMSRPRVLLIAPECPWPPDMGLKTHLYHVIEAWAPVASLTVFGFHFSGEERACWRAYAQRSGFTLGGLEPVLTGWPLRLQQARAFAAGLPLAPARYCAGQARAMVQGLIHEAARQGQPFDWLVHEVFHTLMPVDLPAPGRRLLFPVDSYSLYYRRLHQFAGSPAEWLRSRYLRRVCARMERDQYRGIDRIVTVAEPDAVALRRHLPEARIDVVPVPVPPGVERVFGPRADRPRRVLVAGYFGISSVARDTRRFLEHWRALGPVEPQAELIVWGRGARRAGLEAPASAAGARIVEWADDYSAFLASGDIYVYPQRFTCGVQTKVQQALRARLAVVAVPGVLEPLGVRHGHEGWMVAGPAEAARDLAALLADPACAERLGAAGASLMERECSPASLYPRLRGLIGACLLAGSTAEPHNGPVATRAFRLETSLGGTEGVRPEAWVETPEGEADDTVLHC